MYTLYSKVPTMKDKKFNVKRFISPEVKARLIEMLKKK